MNGHLDQETMEHMNNMAFEAYEDARGLMLADADPLSIIARLEDCMHYAGKDEVDNAILWLIDAVMYWNDVKNGEHLWPETDMDGMVVLFDSLKSDLTYWTAGREAWAI